MRIGITCNLKNDFPIPPDSVLPDDLAEEFDDPITIEAIKDVLAGEGHEVYIFKGDASAADQIKQLQIQFVFNIAEGVSGPSREAQIPALLELLGIPYTGSNPLALTLALDKALAKQTAISLSVPTPEFWVLYDVRAIKQIPDCFPLFVKPLWEGSSKGIRFSSRVTSREELGREVNRIFQNYPATTVLVEEYVPGRELTVGVLGNENPEILGVMEIAFRDKTKKDFCYSLEVKRDWRNLVDYHVPAALDSKIEAGIKDASLRLFKALHLRDVARFDFRLDSNGIFYFLEVNSLPGLSPESGDLVILAAKSGWSYPKLILAIFHAALSRYPLLTL